jgi:DNA polymerase (family 10)
MRNKEVAAVLNDIGDLLDVLGEERWKAIAYRRAARQIEGLTEDIEELWRQGRLRSVPGIGEALAKKIADYLEDGRMAYYEGLREKVPAGLVDVMGVPGVGPKKAQILWQRLGVTNLEELEAAAKARRLRRLKGFQAKTEENILKGIELVKQGRRRTLLADAWPVVEEMIAYLKDHAPVDRVAPAGSFRRMKETVGDVDLLVESRDHSEVAKAFTTMPWVGDVVLAGETKCTVLLRTGLQVDLRILDAESWGSGLLYFTGSKDHNIRLRGLAQKKGLKLSEYGLFRGDERVAGATEAEVYDALGCAYIEPEMREDQGEIEAARRGTLPRLVTVQDIRGDFHAHTNRTDGADTLEQMVAAARARGYAFLGISDHSPSLVVAKGLDPEALLARRDEIRALNEATDGFRVLLGTECDILEDGTLDYDDDVLAELDYAIAAVHSKFNLPEEAQTERVVRAAKNRYVNILAHPTTRRIGQREPIALDMEGVMDACASHRTALEINAHPDRSDLDGTYAKMAKERGAVLAIDTDAHATSHLDFMRFGVGLARRGWLERDDVLNAWDVDRMLAWLR